MIARGPLAAVLVAAAVLAAGCGGGSSPAQSGTSSAAASGTGTTVTVSETEFKLTLSQSSFTPGTYTFVAKDTGTVPHTLEINGPGVSNKVIPQTLQPGQSASLTVTLRAGTYELWCPIDGHKGLGMDVHIHVG